MKRSVRSYHGFAAVRRQLNWPRACLAATFYVIALLLACQDMTRGGRLLGAAVLLGSAWFGAVLAGLLVGVRVLAKPGFDGRLGSRHGSRPFWTLLGASLVS
jgi:hypothetical protein